MCGCCSCPVVVVRYRCVHDCARCCRCFYWLLVKYRVCVPCAPLLLMQGPSLTLSSLFLPASSIIIVVVGIVFIYCTVLPVGELSSAPSTFTSTMYIHDKPCSFLALCNCQFLCTLSPCFQCTSAPVYSAVSKVILTSSSGVRDWPPTGTYRTAAQKRNALRLARAHPTAERKKARKTPTKILYNTMHSCVRYIVRTRNFS